MTIVVSHRHRVHFTMEGERGAFLILHHGLFGSQRDWYRAGYVEALANDFRLILPDARGHGRSDRPVYPAAYTAAAFSDDLIAVMNDLDVRNAHFVGYSLGALVGFDLVMRHPERVRLIMLGGESPAVTTEAQAVWREAASRIHAGGLAPWLSAEREAARIGGEGTPDEESEREPAAAMLEALAGWEVPQADSFQVGSPITIFAGAEDPAYERTQTASRRFQRARFIPFPGQTHRGLFESKDAFLEATLRFIKISRRPDGSPGENRESGEAQEENGAPERGPSQPSWRGQGQGQNANDRRGGRGGRNDRRGNFRRDRPWQSRPEGDGARSDGTPSQPSPQEQTHPASPGAEAVPAPDHPAGAEPDTTRATAEGGANANAASERDTSSERDSGPERGAEQDSKGGVGPTESGEPSGTTRPDETRD